MTFRRKSGVDGALGYYCATNIKRYQAEKVCSIMEARKAIGDLCIDEALRHVTTAKELAKIIIFQRRHGL